MSLSKIELIALIVALFVGLHFYNKYKLENEIDYSDMEAPAFVTKDGRTPVIVAFGDSLTAGTGTSKDLSYPAQLSTMLGVEVINAGVAGERSVAAVGRIDSILKKYKPDLVLIEIGFDDQRAGRKHKTTANNLLKIVRKVKKANATPIVLGLPDLDLTDLNIAPDLEFYEKVAQKTGARYISGAFSDALTDEELMSDFTYPNAKGYRKAAETIFQSLQGMLL